MRIPAVDAVVPRGGVWDGAGDGATTPGIRDGDTVEPWLWNRCPDADGAAINSLDDGGLAMDVALRMLAPLLRRRSR